MRTQGVLPVLALALGSASLAPHGATPPSPGDQTRTSSVRAVEPRWAPPTWTRNAQAEHHATGRVLAKGTQRARAHHHPAPVREQRARSRARQPERAAKPAHPAPAHHAEPARPGGSTAGPTGWPALNDAISRIPSYRTGAARWVVASPYGHWGTSDWYHDVIYIAPTVPSSLVYSVAVHEWSHLVSVHVYGSVSSTMRALDLAYGASGMMGAELAADCMARVQGATWTGYTSCTRSDWLEMGRRLVAGLPAASTQNATTSLP